MVFFSGDAWNPLEEISMEAREAFCMRAASPLPTFHA
jgi:hypothetical protein